jgi:hypothetical protein
MKSTPIFEKVWRNPPLRSQRKEFPSISYSAISTFNTCRMKHYWIYDRQLEKQVFDPKPMLGSMGHAALEALYSGQNHIVHLARWAKQEIEKVKDDIFEETREHYWQLADLVGEIVDRYIEHHAVADKALTMVSVEQEFAVKLPGLGRELIGFWDALVRDISGRYWIRDYKFVGGKFKTDDDTGKLVLSSGGQFRQDWELELDLQIGLYQWAALALGIPVVGTIYDQIRAGVPKVPELLKSGKGVSRSRIATDWPTYRNVIVENGFDPDDYADVMGWSSMTEWFRRSVIIRTPDEIENFALDTFAKVKEMQQSERNRKRTGIVPMTPSRMNCSPCAFRELCLERIKGRDVESLIEMDYQPRSRRADHIVSFDEIEEEEEVI